MPPPPRFCPQRLVGTGLSEILGVQLVAYLGVRTSIAVFTQVRPPAWLEDGADASGRFLAEVGLPMAALNPEHALLLGFTAL